MSLEELGRFLRARRNALPPPEAPSATGPARRVPGQRREEVAAAAAISTDYYTKLEQGRAAVPSDQVVSSLGRVMEWTEEERHYVDLLRRPPTRRPRGFDGVCVNILSDLVCGHTAGPALLLDHTLDVLATNAEADAVFFEPYGLVCENLNFAWWIFGTQAARDAFLYWRPRADAVVASLRMSMADNPDDAGLVTLVACLGRFPAFARLWGSHAAIGTGHGVERFRVGENGIRIYRYVTLRTPSAQWPRTVLWHPATNDDARPDR